LAALVCAGTDAAAMDRARDGESHGLLPEYKLSLALAVGADDVTLPPEMAAPERKPKSYAAVIPMAFFVGFGSAHFYIGAKWRGLRHCLYDIISLGLDATLMALTYKYADGDSIAYMWIVAAVVFGGMRVYQTVDASLTLREYNKGYDMTDAMAPHVSPSDVAVKLNDGGMPRGKLKTVFTF
jgi:hypothetical protein